MKEVKWRQLVAPVLLFVIGMMLFAQRGQSQGAVAANATGSTGRYTLSALEYESGGIKLSTILRVDALTGKTWSVRIRSVQPNPSVAPGQYVEWIDLGEAGSRPSP